MEITFVSVHKVNEDKKEGSRLRGYASVKIDDCFVINDMRIIEGDKGLFVAMPSRIKPDGKHQDIAHPINQETRKIFEDAIIEEYNRTAE